MHFWIDKRSPQACIYSRSRVAASLGTNGNNFGLSQLTAGRRIPRSATKSMVTPIHRFPTVECTRPHLYRNQQQSPSSLSHQSQNNSSHAHPQNHFNFSGAQVASQANHHHHHNNHSTSSSSSTNQYSIHRVYHNT